MFNKLLDKKNKIYTSTKWPRKLISRSRENKSQVPNLEPADGSSGRIQKLQSTLERYNSSIWTSQLYIITVNQKNDERNFSMAHLGKVEEMFPNKTLCYANGRNL